VKTIRPSALRQLGKPTFIREKQLRRLEDRHEKQKKNNEPSHKLRMQEKQTRITEDT